MTRAVTVDSRIVDAATSASNPPWRPNLDATTEFLQLGASGERNKFIPVRKEDLLAALIKQGAFADTAECELFWRFARTLRSICHYEYSETLDRLRDDYYARQSSQRCEFR
jgi:hypothetical protein